MNDPVRDREGLILEEIRQNPFITQQELADQLGISRSAVAGIIAGLVKQGRILGRAYVLAEMERIVCIGGANIDWKARTEGAMELGTSNPVRVGRSFGGVARNMAESLARVGLPASLMTVVGEDPEGRSLLKDCGKFGVDVSLCRHLPGCRTGNYTAVLDPAGEMLLGLADMDIYQEITVPMIESSWSRIRNSEMVIMDTNLPSKVIRWIIRRGETEPITLCVMPVSVAKAKRLPRDLSGVDLLIGNGEEVGAMTGEPVRCRKAAEVSCQRLIERGAARAVITLGSGGAVYREARGSSGWIPAAGTMPVDVTGAGDAFAAGVVAGLYRQTELGNACRLGTVFSKAAIESEHSVPAVLTPDWLQKRWEENHVAPR